MVVGVTMESVMYVTGVTVMYVRGVTVGCLGGVGVCCYNVCYDVRILITRNFIVVPCV